MEQRFKIVNAQKVSVHFVVFEQELCFGLTFWDKGSFAKKAKKLRVTVAGAIKECKLLLYDEYVNVECFVLAVAA